MKTPDSIPTGFQFRVPWLAADHRSLEEELAREMSRKHPLYGVEARAVARRKDCDDVLFQLFGKKAPAGFAVVHLTWSGHPDQYPKEFPSTELYSTFEDWVARCMNSDAEDWELSESDS